MEHTITTSPHILIAGLGNIFLGDDAFGVEVAQRLADRRRPGGVKVADFGIRGLDLTNALLDDGYTAAILIDAVSRGEGPPGTLYVIEPDIDEAPLPEGEAGPGVFLDAHDLDPAKVLAAVRAMGGTLDRMLLVGCEVAPPDAEQTEEEAALPQMCPAVRAAVEEAAALTLSLVEGLGSRV